MAKLELSVIPRGSLLVPADEYSENAIRDLAKRDYKCQITQDRSLPQLKFWHGLAKAISVAMVEIGKDAYTPEWVKANLKIAAGYCEVAALSPALRKATGERFGVMAKSLSFRSMDQDEMNRFMNNVIRFVIAEVLPRLPEHRAAQIMKIINEASLPAHLKQPPERMS